MTQNIEYVNEIKDPIHGYIKITEEEQKLLDHPKLQRLRRIKQLGLCNIVYPSANHTRFEHTLGVLANTQKYIQTLNLDTQTSKELRTAAILHDVGHGPFSHLSERALNTDHEQQSCKTAEKLQDLYQADTQRVKKIIKGELEIAQVIHGDVDADRLDYLKRDAYNTGIQHGNIDTETIINNALLDNHRLVYDYKAIQALENLLVARLHMIKSTYHHHTALIAEKMMQKSIKNAEKHISSEQLSKMDDAQLRYILEGDPKYPYYRKIKNRNLFKRAGTIPEDIDKTEEEIRQEIAEATETSKEKILVDKRKIGEDPENPERNQTLGIKVKHNGEIKKLSDVSDIPSALKHYETSYKVYAPETEKDKIIKSVNNLYG